MRWKVEQARHKEGWSTWLVVDDDQFDPHPEAMRFAVALEGAEKSPNTVRTYMLAVSAFLTWAAADGARWQSVNVLDLVRFKRHLQVVPSQRTGRPRAPRTVSVTLTAVTEFLRFCAANGHIEATVADRLVEKRWIQPRHGLGRGEGGQFHRTRINALRVKVAEQPPEVLSSEQVAEMREYAQTARDRFLLRVLHEGGPRIGETLGLLGEDIHLLPDSRALGCAVTGPHFHVRRRTDNENHALAKSKAPRHVPVADSFVGDYRDYQYERFAMLGESQSRFLFVNYRGAAVGGRDWCTVR